MASKMPETNIDLYYKLTEKKMGRLDGLVGVFSALTFLFPILNQLLSSQVVPARHP